MKKLLSSAITIITSTYASSVCANEHWYLGAFYDEQEISRDNQEFNTIGVIAGFQYNKYFSLETRLSTGASGYSSFYGTSKSQKGNYKEDIDSQTSMLIKASYPIFESFNIYALTGYSMTKLEINGLGQINDENSNIIGDYPYQHTETVNGFSYGLGLNYQFNKQLNIFVDYQVLPNFEPSSQISKSWKSYTIGINYIL